MLNKKTDLRRNLRLLYYSYILFVNRLPIWFVKIVSYFPIKIFNYEKKILSPPSRTCNTYDWFLASDQVSNDKSQFLEVEKSVDFVRSNQPKTADSVEHKQFSLEKIATPLKSFILTIPKGRVWGEYGAIITDENTLLEDLSVYRGNGSHRLYREWHLCSIKKIQGSAVALATDAASIYYHWMTDFLLRYALLQRAGFKLDSFDKIIIGDYSKPFQSETLELLGITQEEHSGRLISMREYSHIQADLLVVPSYPVLGGQYRKWHIDFFRESFLPKLSVEESRSCLKQRIYVSRGDASYRRVLNEGKVIEVLQAHGFKAVQFGKLSFLEQVSLMHSAEAVVSPHGSGLVNLAFCDPGTKVIEIFSPEMVALHFWRISDLCHLDYYYTVGDQLRSEAFDQTWNAAADILVSIDRLKRVLRLAGLDD